MDGARLMNAAVYAGISPSNIVKNCDTVTFCLDKSLGAPMGSLIVGTRHFVERYFNVLYI